MVEGALKHGNPEEAAWLLDEGGEEAVGGAAPRPRWALFDAPECGGQAAAAEELRERAPRGLRFCEPKVDFDFGPRIEGPLADWRSVNPGAEVADVYGKRDLRDADFVHLVGLKAVYMDGCTGITDAGLAHIAGIHTLDIEGCTGITDAGLAHLAGIHTLDMRYCPGITDAGLAHLTGIHTLKMRYCRGITDAGLAHLAGIHTLDMSVCTGITDAGLAHLAGIQTLEMAGCAPTTIDAARARGLPVRF